MFALQHNDTSKGTCKNHRFHHGDSSYKKMCPSYVPMKIGLLPQQEAGFVFQPTQFSGALAVPLPEIEHIPPWEKENRLQTCLGWGYVNSQQGNLRGKEIPVSRNFQKSGPGSSYK